MFEVFPLNIVFKNVQNNLYYQNKLCENIVIKTICKLSHL